ncbi:folylpolyglutamate synthase/dihydrofolate synthase family protein [Flavobacterium rakeshii]|uniref:bifunctional folylpolyglutamate synthase/dihydrofolate synthase n=1 Tax=Flavobacterium rakeshii TaxID=1038845 RepID=UPI002E7BA248|nr:folylpolyglutamate synthase/dihydrofolate synthase family protein [Flavobacterium rakeshii]MEE1896707.1 folylpolyglutamate synthase/dihydrofolate synthase family protein [Flavobacterium rakeshii]
MTYQETIEWMFNQLPMYQTQGASAFKKDLTNTLLLAKHLNNPENGFKSVHVAGTNGKGSVSNMLASILQEAGYKVGLYTSPHLKDFRERIKINGEDISKEFVMDFMYKNKRFFEASQLSFFEMTVGLAFDYFTKEKVDVAIVETGMGGRLDSTNIVTPLVSVITNIGFDHTQFLGDTLEKIAFEKAGIIKNNIPVIIGEYTPETKAVFEAKAKEMQSDITFASDVNFPVYESDLTGDYQKQNRKTVLATINVLKHHFDITEEALVNGLLNVVKNTGFMGRWQVIHQNPTAVCDTAHNSHGLKIVLNQIAQQKFKDLRIVFGVVNDKDLTEILPLMPKNAIYYFCKPNVMRGLDEKNLQEKFLGYDLKGGVYCSVADAYENALADADENDFVYVGGSTFVVAEIL